MVDTITHGAQECLSVRLSRSNNVNKGLYFPSNEVGNYIILQTKKINGRQLFGGYPTS